MSVKVMAWVWDNSRSRGNDRLVLLAIADHAGDDGGDAWPSIATLCRKTGISERTVQRCIQSLAELGELVVDSVGNGRKSSRYRVKMRQGRQTDTPVILTPPSERHPRQSDTPEGCQSVVEGCQDDTLTIHKPSKDPKTKNSSSEADASDPAPIREDVERICVFLADSIETTLEAKRPKITKAWRDEARRLLDLDGRTERQVLDAITWAHADDFWRSNILSMPKLRAKYDQLRLAAQRKQTRPTNLNDRLQANADVARRMAERAATSGSTLEIVR